MREDLTFIEIIKESYRIFKANAVKILVLVVMMVLPLQIITGVVYDRMNNDEAIATMENQLFSLEEKYKEDDPTDQESQEIVTLFMDLLGRMAPYYVVILAVSVLALVFDIAIAKLTKDEGTHGALNPGYKAGEIIVVYDDNGEENVGTVSDYFMFGLKKLPATVLTFLVFIVLGAAFCWPLIIPGGFVFILSAFAVPIVAYGNLFGFKAFVASLKIAFKKPTLLAYFVICLCIKAAFAYFIAFLYDLIGLSGIVDIVLSALVSAAISFAMCILDIVALVAFLDKLRKKEDN